MMFSGGAISGGRWRRGSDLFTLSPGGDFMCRRAIDLGESYAARAGPRVESWPVIGLELDEV